jgi:endoglucanase
MRNQLIFMLLAANSFLFASCKNAESTSSVTKTTEKSSYIERFGQLQVIGTKLCGKDGNPVVLRGVSFGWHNWWGDFYNKDVVNALTDDWKVSIVRAAMGVGPENDYRENQAFAEKCVTNVVDQAIERGIYVIIDFHSHDIYLPEAKAFFTKMATKYGKYPNVIYEIFNEPIHQSWPEVKAYSEDIIKTIRAIDPDNIILVGNPHWCQDLHLAAADPIKNQTNLMYVLHFYAGTHKRWLRDRADAAINAGLPVFVSECAGMEASGDGPIDEAEWKAYVEWMESRQLSWVVWSMSAKEETCSMVVPDASRTGKWKETDIKPWGKICREYIQLYNKR